MLDFITQNKDLISIIIISFSGLFVFIKWFDARNRELKESRYRTYMNLIGVISGKRADSSTPSFSEQIAATWFLLEYREYHEVTKRIFPVAELSSVGSKEWVANVGPHIQRLVDEIS